MEPVEFRVLGPLEVRRCGQLLELGGPRQRAVLALLVAEANRVVAVETLIDRLWGESPPASAEGTLRAYISNLRRALEPKRSGGQGSALLVTRGSGYMLAIAPESIDASRFQTLVAEVRPLLASDPARAYALLDRALSLWRGPPFADLDSERAVAAEAVRLAELRLNALEDRVEAALALGRHAAVVAEVRHLVALHPLRERLRGQLMLALYRCGRQAEALASYQEGRRVLAEELGLDPAPALRDLEAAILRQDPALLLPPAPALPPPGPRHNLPAALTSFIGREQERAEVAKLLEDCRLVTLTGAGGVGKTRLALEVAAELVGNPSDGVWHVDLAPVSDHGFVTRAVAGTLGVREEAGSDLLETLADRLRDRSLLLVLDNCEHLVATCARAVSSLLAAAPALRVLATSREPLGVPGEVTYRVPSLSVPEAGGDRSLQAVLEYDSGRLFLERARSARPGLSVGSEDAGAIAQICARLDGIPLALELAAARTSLLNMGQIAARLDDRFRLLTGGSRTVLPRHQTLRATLDWSFQLLGSDEQVLLRRLSVFAGGFTLEAAEAVCSGPPLEEAEVLDVLGSLVDKSVVAVEPRADQARYRLLETVRQYGLEKLVEAGEEADVSSRHLHFFLGVAERAEPEAMGESGGPVLDRLEAEHANLRAALQNALEQPAHDDAGLRLSLALYPLWESRDHRQEGRRWMESLLERQERATTVRSAVARQAAVLAWAMGDLAAATELFERGLDEARHAGDRANLGRALISAGKACLFRGDLEAARSRLEEGLAIAREMGDQLAEQASLLWLAWAAHHQGRYEEGRALVEECRRRCEGKWFYLARGLFLLGWIELEQGRYREAHGCFEECRALVVSVGDRESEAEALEGLGSVAAAEGRWGGARRAFEEALAIGGELEAEVKFNPLRGLGEVAAEEGDHAAARRLLEEAVSTARRTGLVVLVARALNGLGDACVTSGDLSRACDAYEEALRIATGAGMPFPLAASVEGLAAVAFVRGDDDRPARIYAAAHAARQRTGAPVPPSARAVRDGVLAALRTRLGEERFRSVWSEGARMDLAEAAALAVLAASV